MRVALAAMLVIAVAALAIGANYALLGFATHRSDPVGNLSPVAKLTPGKGTGVPPAPTTTVGEGQDD